MIKNLRWTISGICGVVRKLLCLIKIRWRLSNAISWKTRRYKRKRRDITTRFANREDICDQILDEFGALGPHSHIINGHVPVKTIQGEQPMKANGKLFRY